ncbi:MAG TPA: DUF6159 family protein [Candidatus Saccharimonadales bacterium]|nr:DUF6159 family protein [Candidatus Saccharimonadales bacterium]
MQDQKLGHFQKSWLLTKAAWNCLKLDKELVTLPFIGMGVSLAVMAAAAALVVIAPAHTFYISNFTGNEGELNLTKLGIASIIALGFVMGGIATYITAAVIHGALTRFNGEDPTIGGSLAAARRRLGSLLAFSVFNSTIGLILSEIINRIPYIGGVIMAWLAQAAWNVASFFAIPVIVSSSKPVTPLAATRKSFGIIRKVWGESLIVTATITLVSMLSIILYAFTIISVVGLFATNGMLQGVALGAVIALAFLGLLMMVIVFSVLEGIIKAAVYHYATTGQSPVTFNERLMREAFTQKKARKVFVH